VKHGLHRWRFSPIGMTVFAVLLAMGLTSCGCGEAQTPAPDTTPPTEAPPEAAVEAAEAQLVEVTFELPREQTIGTPIQAPPGTSAVKNPPPRKPLMAPAGAVNLALGKPVTSSDPIPNMGDLEQITDGDKEAFIGSFIELGGGLQWVQIDLEQPSDIYGILVWHYHEDDRIYRDVVVQIADDADFLTNVRTVFNNDHDNSSGLGAGQDREYFESYQGQLIYTEGQTARYVRQYSRGNSVDDQNHYIEVEVWGVPTE